MSSEVTHNILLIWNRMGDYHRARWNNLSKTWTNGIVYAADLGRGDQLYQWATTHQRDYLCLSDKPVEKQDFIHRFRSFAKIVEDQHIRTVCIPGYGRKEYVAFLLWCKVKGIDVVLFAESWYGQNTWVNKLKAIFLNRVCRKFFVSGLRAEKHFHEILKVPLTNIRRGYSVIDNLHFHPDGVVEKKEKILLCVARFSKEKNHDLLFRAFLKSDLSKTWRLCCVGGGPLQDTFRSQLKSEPTIVIKDWASYEELPALYSSAMAFVLPSRFEPWGLVVNEAMAAGLPVITSDACGCTPDLVGDDNGWIVKNDNEMELIEIFNQLYVMMDDVLIRMGVNSRKRIERYSLDSWCRELIHLVKL